MNASTIAMIARPMYQDSSGNFVLLTRIAIRRPSIRSSFCCTRLHAIVGRTRVARQTAPESGKMALARGRLQALHDLARARIGYAVEQTGIKRLFSISASTPAAQALAS
jgi:hypothetical protein